jgi:hypothetical protein
MNGQWEIADCPPAAAREAVWEMESLALHMWAEERRNCLLMSHRIGVLERIVAELEHTLQGHFLAAAPPGDPRFSLLRGTAPHIKAADPKPSWALTRPSLQHLHEHRQAIADSVALDMKAAAHRQAMADLVGSMQRRWMECALPSHTVRPRVNGADCSDLVPATSWGVEPTDVTLDGCSESEASVRAHKESHTMLTVPIWGVNNHLDSVSLVSFVQDRVFFYEGGEDDFDDATVARFYLFRACGLGQRLGVAYATVDKSDEFDSAIAGRHFQSTQGVAYFEVGASLTFIEVEIANDDSWEPIREFGVHLERVVTGKGAIGKLSTCTCVIIDDDAYPRKIVRPPDCPVKAAEKVLPSCVDIETYLTVQEQTDLQVAKKSRQPAKRAL